MISAIAGRSRAMLVRKSYSARERQHDRGDATVFIPIDRAARAIGRARALVVPGAEVAVMHHRGSLANIDLTYGDLGGYVMKHEINVEGPLRETYHRGFLDTDDAETWDTEIGWPIFRSH